MPVSSAAPAQGTLLAELILLFVAFPLAFRFKPFPFPPIPALWLLAGYGLYRLLREPAFDRTRLWNRQAFLGRAPGILLIFLVVASAVAFSFAHIIFRNPIAIIFTLVGGLLFAWRYAETGSLFTSSFEHALYGCWMFTIGLGEYFYKGAR